MDEEDSEEENAQVIELEDQHTGYVKGKPPSNGDSQDGPEFCDVCSMELINHPDEMPCPPHEGYVKEYSMCPVCCKGQPTREHVASHFMQELFEVVREMETPLTCEKRHSNREHQRCSLVFGRRPK